MERDIDVYNQRWSQSERNTFILQLFVCLLFSTMLPHASADLQNESMFGLLDLDNVSVVAKLKGLLDLLKQAESTASILLNIKAGWGNPKVLSGWSPNVSACSWNSISCDTGNIMVISLVLDSTYVNASLPDTIGDLVNLKNLSLTNLGLTGYIPSSIGQLKNLNYLDFQGNNFVGELPTELSNITRLTYLNLFDNHLKGSIPREIGSLYNLIKLYLGYNTFTGGIPNEISNLTQLSELWLNFNQLSGAIPPGIGSLYNLAYLNLGFNTLTGGIPNEISNLTQLPILYMEKNMLSGPIPVEIGKLYNLISLHIGINTLTEGIPNEISNLTQLSELAVNGNQLSGPIPRGIGTLHNLTLLWLDLNTLTGGIPDEISNLTQLPELWLYGNQLTGSIPHGIGRLYNLIQMHLQLNILTGEIPNEISNLTKLSILYLQTNQLSGPIPHEIGGLYNLTAVHLEGNILTGEIPTELSNLTRLSDLNLSSNFLTGPVPDVFNQLPNLQTFLHFEENCFNNAPTCKCDGNHGKRSDTLKQVFIAVGVIVGTLLTITVTSFLIFCRQNKKTPQTDGNHYVVKQYTLDEVKDATNNFTTILGEGGFAIVYHAKFKDGKEVAVKHFKKRETKDTSLEAFKKEVELLAKIHHRFLVNLIGYCTDQGHHMLLFEFMNEGNLKERLHGGEDSSPLTWEERVRIMISVGHGLEYLHFGRSPPLIHRDIKSANILLSSTKLNPNSILVDHDSMSPKGTTLIAKIADFGLGRETLLDDDKMIQAYGHEYPKPVHTKVAGTPGYIDPEYFRTSVLSSAVDVYSFGVVLLELITGKPALSAPLSGDESWAPLAEWAMPHAHLKEEEILEMVDPRLQAGSYDKEHLLAVAKQAGLCLQKRAHLRPSIRDVVGVFTELFHVETKLVYPSLYMNYVSSDSSHAPQRDIHQLVQEMVGETTSSMENSGS